jgi:hypothetical protein
MTSLAYEREVVEALITRLDGALPEALHLERRPLTGGLEAAGVDHVTARYRTGGRERRLAVVVKRLAGAAVREAAVYEQFVATHASEISPRLYAVEHGAAGHAVLYLEAIRPVSSWPWRDRPAAQSVLDRVARLHARAATQEAVAALAGWDYEAELGRAAARTLERLGEVRRQRGLWSFGGGLRWARRLAAALPALRAQLLTFAPLGSAVIHGDLHSGNVLLRRRGGRTEPALLDWGRARVGSPLEDVSSWLQSLGAWEPEARRRHDTLFAGYLAARGVEPRLDSGMRAAYWLAGASNALAGALTYHLSVLLDPRLPSASRASAAYSAREWVRVLRRADAFWS